MTTHHAGLNESMQVLAGERMWGSARAIDMEMFMFGAKVRVQDRNGKDRETSERGLHVQCAWHITHDDEVLIGYRDVFQSVEGSTPGRDDEADWEPVGANLRDRFLSSWFSGADGFFVEGVQATRGGGLRLDLSDNYCLVLFPDRCSSGGEPAEQWRFIDGSPPDSRHLVVTARGFEWVGPE